MEVINLEKINLGGEYNISQKSHYGVLDISFDTISFIIPFSRNPEFRRLFTKNFDLRRCTWGKEETGTFQSLRFSLCRNEKFTEDFFSREKSYSDNILFSEYSNGFRFQFSAPKFLWGHNCFMLYDLEWFLNYFRYFIQDASGVIIEPVENWIIKRVDFCCNFVLPNLKEVENAISFLSNFRFRNKGCQRTKGKDIAYWTTKRRTLKFYSKALEMDAHRKYFRVSDSYFQRLRLYSEKILRYEEEWRAEYIRYVTGRKGEILFSFFKDFLKSFNLLEYIENLFGDIKQKSIYRSIDDCSQVLDNLIGKKKSALLRFLSLFFSLGDKQLRKIYPDTSYYRLKKDLQGIGIDIDTLNIDNSWEELSFELKDLKLTNYNNDESFSLHKSLGGYYDK